MTGEFKIIGGTSYLQVNKFGTLEKLPKLKWYWIVWFAFKSAFIGPISLREVRDIAFKRNRNAI